MFHNSLYDRIMFNQVLNFGEGLRIYIPAGFDFKMWKYC